MSESFANSFLSSGSRPDNRNQQASQQAKKSSQWKQSKRKEMTSANARHTILVKTIEISQMWMQLSLLRDETTQGRFVQRLVSYRGAVRSQPTQRARVGLRVLKGGRRVHGKGFSPQDLSLWLRGRCPEHGLSDTQLWKLRAAVSAATFCEPTNLPAGPGRSQTSML